eukprot:COSAG03_NODE_6905_length_988_cov_1.445444_1_plen_62_part_10
MLGVFDTVGIYTTFVFSAPYLGLRECAHGPSAWMRQSSGSVQTFGDVWEQQRLHTITAPNVT